MYWGDEYNQRIETANTDGSGRRIIVTVNNARYYTFTLHEGFIYYTSDTPPYVHLLGPPPRNGSSGRLYVLVVMIFFIFFSFATGSAISVRRSP